MFSYWQNALSVTISVLLCAYSSVVLADSAAFVASAIYPGQSIRPDKIKVMEISDCGNCLPGYINDANTLVGMIAIKTILPGQLIYPELLRKPAMVKAGQQVVVTLRAGSLSILMRGESLTSANAGEPITVRNRATGNYVTGRLQPDGSISVDPI